MVATLSNQFVIVVHQDSTTLRNIADAIESDARLENCEPLVFDNCATAMAFFNESMRDNKLPVAIITHDNEKGGGHMGGFQLADLIHVKHKEIPVLMVVDRQNLKKAKEAERSGIAGFFPQSESDWQQKLMDRLVAAARPKATRLVRSPVATHAEKLEGRQTGEPATPLKSGK